MSADRRLDGFETGPERARAAVIWLHGLGADGFDFAPIVPELQLPAEQAVRFVFPHAPRRPVTLNGGMLMRAWYDIRALDLDRRSHDETGIREAETLVSQWIEQEERRGVRPDRIVLAGFSQGGAMAIHAALRFPRRLAGAVALSAYLLLPDRLEEELAPANRGLFCFVAHGLVDPIVALAGGERLRDQLREAGCPVEWRTYDAPHAVHPEEIRDVGRFLSARLA